MANKKIHLIKEDYSSDIEKYCLKTFERDYPDFRFNFWKPGSSPLRILYDNGGLFIGPGIISVSRIPDSCFKKSFVVYDNVFESTIPNINLCCYADKIKDPFYLRAMEIGHIPALKERGLSEIFKVDSVLDKELKDINTLYWDKFVGFDKLAKEVTTDKPFYLLDTNTRQEEGDWHLHYMFIDKDTNSNTAYSICENFSNMKYEDGTNHFMLLVCNDTEHDLTNKLSIFLRHKIAGATNKKFNVITFGNNVEESELYKLTIEYISRRFNKVLSCEKLL